MLVNPAPDLPNSELGAYFFFELVQILGDRVRRPKLKGIETIESPLTNSGLSLCLFRTMEYISDLAKFLSYLLLTPHNISTSVFIDADEYEQLKT